MKFEDTTSSVTSLFSRIAGLSSNVKSAVSDGEYVKIARRKMKLASRNFLDDVTIMSIFFSFSIKSVSYFCARKLEF